MVHSNSDQPWRIVKDRLLLEIKVAAGARRSAVGPVNAGRIKISVTTVAEQGKANRAVIKLLAGWMELAQSAFEIVAGTTNSRKTIAVTAADPKSLAALIRERLLGG